MSHTPSRGPLGRSDFAELTVILRQPGIEPRQFARDDAVALEQPLRRMQRALFRLRRPPGQQRPPGSI